MRAGGWRHKYVCVPVRPLACEGHPWTRESSCGCQPCEFFPPAGLFCWGRGWWTRWGRACCWRSSRRCSYSQPNGLSFDPPSRPGVTHTHTRYPLVFSGLSKRQLRIQSSSYDRWFELEPQLRQQSSFFSQPQRELCVNLKCCVSLMFLIHFVISKSQENNDQTVWRTLNPSHQHHMIRSGCVRARAVTWSYSDDDTMKSIDVIPSKHWNHFCLWDLCPPTSTILKGIFLMTKSCSTIPLVAFLANKMSCLLGI